MWHLPADGFMSTWVNPSAAGFPALQRLQLEYAWLSVKLHTVKLTVVGAVFTFLFNSTGHVSSLYNN